MIRVEEVSARLEAEVPELQGRIFNAGDFANLVERNQLPQLTPAAYVLPAGLRGGQGQVVTGMFRQSFTETVSVVLVTRVAGDPLHQRAIDEITPLVRSAVDAICGWGPAGAIGVFDLGSGELVGAKDSALVFHLDFTLEDQLRIM